MTSWNPLKDTTNAIMAHMPDTLAGQAWGIGLGALATLLLLGAIVVIGYWICKKMGYEL